MITPLAVLALSTSIWGFALRPPTAPSSLVAPASLASASLGLIHEVEVEGPPRLELEAHLEAVERTHTLMDWIRVLQVGTEVAMITTVTLGAITFSDRYGFHDAASETPCARGTAVLGYCGGDTAVAYLVAAGTTGAFGLTGFAFWTQLDVDTAVEIDGDWRIYEVTRLLARLMNAAGAAFGFFLSNAVEFGWADEQADFQVLQAMGIAHTTWGIATLAVETANTVLVF